MPGKPIRATTIYRNPGGNKLAGAEKSIQFDCNDTNKYTRFLILLEFSSDHEDTVAIRSRGQLLNAPNAFQSLHGSPLRQHDVHFETVTDLCECAIDIRIDEVFPISN